jgi:periplasmic protein TonB
MTALRHILVSTGLHGMFAVGVLLLLFGVQAVQEHRQTIMVQLIETAVTPAAVEPASSVPAPELHVPSMQETVRADSPRVRHIRRAVHRDTPRVSHASAIPTSRSVGPPSETFISPSRESAPVFLEMRRHSHAAAPVATTASEAMTLPIDTILAPSTLSTASIVPPLFRPILTGRKESRPVLRDSSAEKPEAVRSKARSGQNLRPDYPRTAQEAGWEGTVMLRVEVLPDGNAGSVSVQRTSGHAILDDAARTAVERWHFSPAMDGNFPIRSVVNLPVKFDLMTP